MAGPLTGHGHGHGASPSVEIGVRARTLLLAGLALAAVATVVGLVVLWPDDTRVQEVADRAEFVVPGTTFPEATVLEVEECSDDASQGCGVRAEVTEGAGAGDETEFSVPSQVVDGGLRAGDTVQVQRTERTDGGAGGGSSLVTYTFSTPDRDLPLGLLVGAFVLVVVAVARLRGLLAIVGLGVAGVVIVFFMLPALLSGSSGAWVAMVSGSAIMFVVLYSTHGVSLRTSVALGGTLIGIALTAGIGALTVRGSRLSGTAEESSNILSAFASDLSFQGLLTCAVIVAGLGVLNDVTITQSSSVWEIRAAAPAMSRLAVYRSGMRIGRDHIASTIYTIVFAYAGSALTVLLLLYLYERPVLDLVSTEELASEIVRTLTTSIGLVLAVPVTTGLAALVAGPGRDGSDAGPDAGPDDAPDVGSESFWLRRAQRPRGGRRRAT